MVRAVTPQAPAAHSRPRRRKLTLREATDQWAEATCAIDELNARRKEAAAVLIAHVERTGRRTFFDRIAAERSGGSLVLDQAKVKEYLGAQLADFQTRTKLGWSLKLLQ